MKRDDAMITVCNSCLLASCWRGVFLCDDAYMAGTTKKTKVELVLLGREHKDWWDDETYNRIGRTMAHRPR